MVELRYDFGPLPTSGRVRAGDRRSKTNARVSAAESATESADAKPVLARSRMSEGQKLVDSLKSSSLDSSADNPSRSAITWDAEPFVSSSSSPIRAPPETPPRGAKRHQTMPAAGSPIMLDPAAELLEMLDAQMSPTSLPNFSCPDARSLRNRLTNRQTDLKLQRSASESMAQAISPVRGKNIDMSKLQTFRSPPQFAKPAQQANRPLILNEPPSSDSDFDWDRVDALVAQESATKRPVASEVRASFITKCQLPAPLKEKPVNTLGAHTAKGQSALVPEDDKSLTAKVVSDVDDTDSDFDDDALDAAISRYSLSPERKPAAKASDSESEFDDDALDAALGKLNDADTATPKVVVYPYLLPRSTHSELHRYEVVSTSFPSDLVNMQELVVKDAYSRSRIVKLHDSWAETSVSPGDIVHVVGKYNDDDPGSVSVQDGGFYLIVSPDLLITATNVTKVLRCERKVVIAERLRALPGGETNKFMLYGNIMHTLIQSSFAHHLNFTEKYLIDTLDLIIPTFEKDLLLASITDEEARSELRERIPAIMQWASKFVGENSSQIPNHRGQTKTNVSVKRAIDIEEEIWSPMFGIQGKIDVTAEVERYDGKSSLGRFLVPLEIKTSKSTYSEEHNAQVILYTLLLADRYDLEVEFALLYYSHIGHMTSVRKIPLEVRLLLQTRNRLAQSIKVAQQSSVSEDSKNFPLSLPSVLGNRWECKRCERLKECMVFHKASNGSPEETGLDDYEDLVAHITANDISFLSHWYRLLELENSNEQSYTKEMWNADSMEREKRGTGYGGLVVDSLKETSIDPITGLAQYVYVLKRKEGDDGTQMPFGTSEITPADAISISDEKGHYQLARGRIISTTGSLMTISTNKRLLRQLKRDDSFDATNQIFQSQLCIPPGLVDEKRDDFVLRIDKDGFAKALATSKYNLIQLFVKDGDEKRRSLIVDKRAPTFVECSTELETFLKPYEEGLNTDQKKALRKVFTAQDYALILGMPGTGKTTLIAKVVTALVDMGKTVLLSSYTHSAVDNILLKLEGIDILRLGRAPSRVQESIHQYMADVIDPVSGNSKEYIDRFMKPPVVAATSLGVTHWVMSVRKFDYCIVDEASQITLPACIGPLRYADKFVLVGDHYQLPPLIKDARALEGGLGQSLFEILSSNFPDAISNLSLQYRMNEDIMAVSNAMVYEGKLRCGNLAVAKQSLLIPFPERIGRWLNSSAVTQDDWLSNVVMNPERRVLFLNTDTLEYHGENVVNERVQNPVEAQIVSTICQAFSECGVEDSQIGVIAAYRAQLRLIHRQRPYGCKIEMLTADKSQGRDKDCIIISFVRSNSQKQVGDLLRDWRRLNVVFTRARRKLLLVGSRETLRGDPTVKTFIDLLERNNYLYNLPRQALTIYNVPTPPKPGSQVHKSGAKVLSHSGPLDW